MTACSTVTPGVDVISTTAEFPGLGCLAVNAFVLHGAEPILVADRWRCCSRRTLSSG